MAYQIDRFNGTFLVSVDDQTLNSTATDLRFVGRNYSGYGEIENENLLHLLENFANSSAPPRAISGQLWFDTSTKKLNVFDGTKFKVISGAEASATAPAGLTQGDFWWDNQNEQMFVWNGTEFILVGPEKSPIYGDTATAPAVIKDTFGRDQQILKFQISGEIIAIVSKNNFTINSTINPITGFGELKPGINFTINSTGVWGTVNNSEKLGGFSASDFLRSANTSFNTVASFKDGGFTVGEQSDLRIRVINGSTPIIESTHNRPFIFRISNNEADIKDIMVVSTTSVSPASTGLYDIGSTASKWKTVHAETVRATTFYGSLNGVLVETSSIAFKENVNPLTNALDMILQLTGVSYDRKDKSAINEPGLIAEEVNKIMPNIVVKDDKGNPYGIQYTKVIAYLIEAIKDQQTQINELKKKV